jgi:hypothetical protein
LKSYIKAIIRANITIIFYFKFFIIHFYEASIFLSHKKKNPQFIPLQRKKNPIFAAPTSPKKKRGQIWRL